MAYTPKPVGNVAGMGAELPMAVAVNTELFAAVRAGESIDCLPLHQLQMGIPPLVPAGIRAEPFPLPSRILLNGPATLLADRCRLFRNQAVPPAERFHRIDGNTNCCRNLPVPCPIPAQGDNLLLLFIRHRGHLLKI